MKIGELLRQNQPETYNDLNKPKEKSIKKQMKREVENLSEYDIKQLMGHSSYRRINRAIRQVR